LITRGQTVPEFENVAFSLKPGETSGVIKTQYGYHILQVLAREEARVKPFEEVKAELTEQIKKQRAADIIQNVADRVEPELRKNPLNPEKVASEFNMDVVKAEGFTAGTTIPEVGASPDFERVVVGLKQGEVSPVVGLQGNKIAIAVVTGVTPARPNTFEEVQDRIREGMIQNRAVTLLQQRAQQLTEAARKSGDLAASAKAMGFEVKTSEEVNRSGSVEGLGSATAFSDAFGRPDRTVLGPINIPNGMGVIQVLQHIPADMAGLAQQRDQLKQEIDSRQRRERVQLFDEGIREELTRRGKIKVNGPAITRLISSYSAS
jgi:peptidyl-prolyl cis-trans isomerase D